MIASSNLQWQGHHGTSSTSARGVAARLGGDTTEARVGHKPRRAASARGGESIVCHAIHLHLQGHFQKLTYAAQEKILKILASLNKVIADLVLIKS